MTRAEHMRSRRVKLKAAGLCVDCGHRKGTPLCDNCRTDRRLRYYRKRGYTHLLKRARI